MVPFKAEIPKIGAKLQTGERVRFDNGQGNIYESELFRDMRAAWKRGELESLEFEGTTFRTVYPNQLYIRIHRKDEASFAASFTGRTFLRDHLLRQVTARLGTIINSSFQGKDLRQRLQVHSEQGFSLFFQRLISFFSVGASSEGMTCTVCGNDWHNYELCRHWPGIVYQYNGEDVLCERILEKPVGLETSAVNDPAVLGTAINQLFAKGDVQMDEKLIPDVAASLAAAKTGSAVSVTFQTAPRSGEGPDEPEESGEPESGGDAPPAPETEAADVPFSSPEGVPTVGGVEPDSEKLARILAESEAVLRRQTQLTANEIIARANFNADEAKLLEEILPENHTLADVDKAVAAVKRFSGKREKGVVKGMRPITAGDMSEGIDMARASMDFFFGVKDAKAPPPSMRRFDDLYIAMTGDWEWHWGFHADRVQFASVDSASFPGLVSESMNKAVADLYGSSRRYRWYERIVSLQPNDGSSHPLELIAIDGPGEFPDVPEGQSYDELQMTSLNNKGVFTKGGGYVGITQEVIMQNKTQFLRMLPFYLNRTSVRTRSAKIARFFTSNNGVGPTLAQPNRALFHADNGNLITTAFGQSGWAEARRKVLTQKPNGVNNLAELPRFALLPAELYDSGRVQFGRGQGNVGRPNAAGTAQEVNPYAEDFEDDARGIPLLVPEFTDANDWAAVCEPMDYPTIAMSFIQERAGLEFPPVEIFPETSGQGMWEADELRVKARDWPATGIISPYGMVKSNVT